MDGIQLEIMWSNMISIVSDQAKALKRTAFSPIVREAGDLATALFDSQGRMVAQALTGTPVTLIHWAQLRGKCWKSCLKARSILAMCLLQMILGYLRDIFLTLLY